MKLRLYFTWCFVVIAFSFLQAQQLKHVLGDILIKPKPNVEAQRIVNKFQGFGNQIINLRLAKTISAPMHIYLLQFDYQLVDENVLLLAIQNDPEMETAQFNHLVQSRVTPNDPLFGQQWQWMNAADADVDAELAWDITTGGTTTDGDEIVVAALDDGTDLTHPDLMANHWVNTAEIENNGIDDDGNGYVDDYNGWNIISDDDNVSGGNHGVNVNGMIGAVGNDGNQGTGINWNVKIMTIKNNFNTNEAAVLEAYNYPYIMRQRYNNSNGAEGAFVVATNASWGIDGGNPSDAPLWCDFYDTMGAEGILNCGATSNANFDVDAGGDLPTTCPSEFMIGVTRTTDTDTQEGGYGPINIDIGSPGVNIYTTAAGGGYTFTTGTSFASPLTAGLIGLIYAVPCPSFIALVKANPQLGAQTARSYLLDGADSNILPTNRVADGRRANAFGSVQLVLDNCGPPHCGDGVMSGDETGVDCGGSCIACPTCTDGLQNGDEEGVDCGGSCVAVCPTCTDNIQNGDEEGVDCGGSTCPECPCTDIEVVVSITLDDWPNETTWSFVNNTTTNTVASGGSYPGQDFATVTANVCLEAGVCYDFTINDSYGDGICCGYGNGSYSVNLLSDNSVLASGGAFGDFETTTICFDGCVPTMHEGGSIAAGTYSASNTITADGSIASPDVVSFDAGDCIELQPNFEVALGADFHAYIQGCSPSSFTSNDGSSVRSYQLERVIKENAIYHYSKPKAAYHMIEYQLASDEQINVSLQNINGDAVKILIDNQAFQKGNHRIKLPVQDLASGIYMLVLKTKNERLVQKIVL